MIDLNTLPKHARAITRALEAEGFAPMATMQVIALAEEVGEFVGAARRHLGMARRSGSRKEVEEELADVVITAFVTADVFGFELRHIIQDKLDIIFARGWRERTESVD